MRAHHKSSAQEQTDPERRGQRLTRFGVTLGRPSTYERTRRQALALLILTARENRSWPATIGDVTGSRSSASLTSNTAAAPTPSSDAELQGCATRSRPLCRRATTAGVEVGSDTRGRETKR